MGRKLPPGEAARRRAARAKATWSGERYQRYNPEDGFGSRQQWTGAAEAFVNGNVAIAGVLDADLVLLGLLAPPASKGDLLKARRTAVKLLHAKFGSDTADGYKLEFQAIYDAVDRIVAQKGW